MRFEEDHPLINFIYFAAAICFASAFSHPLFVGIGFACALICCARCRGRRGLALGLLLLPATALWTLWYASFHHFGVTVLGTNSVGNRITLESIVSGLIIGVRAATVILLASAFIAVFTTDKVTYLTGRISPRLSLYLAILFRWLPETRRSGRRIREARKGIGLAHHPLQIISATMTQMMERFGTLSESMRARGYGLKGRTAYALYRFGGRERIIVLILCAAVIATASGAALGHMSALYNPQIMIGPVSPLTLIFAVIYAAFLLFPVIPELFRRR